MSWLLLVAADHIVQTLRMFAQVERMNDEGVKLKMLQTALTLMQSHELAQNEVTHSASLPSTFASLSSSAIQWPTSAY